MTCYVTSVRRYSWTSTVGTLIANVLMDPVSITHYSTLKHDIVLSHTLYRILGTRFRTLEIPCSFANDDRCPRRNKGFSTAYDAKAHEMGCPANPARVKLFCTVPNCGKYFYRFGQLNAHKRTHTASSKLPFRIDKHVIVS